MGIREEMPLLARHEGDWKGTYRYIDPSSKITDQHESLITCDFPAEGEFAYRQTNRYKWADGKEEIIDFPATYQDRRIYFDTERLKGYAWEVDDKTIVLTWVYNADPNVYLYEMIQLDKTGNHRHRTWHWFKDGVCFQRTLIDENRVT
jgi:hypothetical protein